MKIYLLRHSETELNEKDIISGDKDAKLTERGKKQAKNLGEFLRTKHISKIYTSDIKGSKETAKLIAEAIKKKPKIIRIKKFNERNLGFFQGKRWDVISVFYKEYLFKSENRLIKTILEPKNGETWEELKNRVISAINDILEKNKKPIVIVGHLDVNRILLRYMGNMTEKEMYEIWQTSSSVNLIEYKNEKFEIKVINYILSKNR
ncbi:histidine phosphatase family protein [Candidatus Micrarchaeota archaeon]|jgi:broad specificity phosphatase PhoE|nr:histidine phosphatase family protein [Candidatus Micrarchaeota archaeon]